MLSYNLSIVNENFAFLYFFFIVGFMTYIAYTLDQITVVGGWGLGDRDESSLDTWFNRPVIWPLIWNLLVLQRFRFILLIGARYCIYPLLLDPTSPVVGTHLRLWSIEAHGEIIFVYLIKTTLAIMQWKKIIIREICDRRDGDPLSKKHFYPVWADLHS